MKSPFVCRPLGIILVILCSTAAGLCADEELPPFDVDQFLSGPDQRDFLTVYKTDVFRSPDLPFQQYAVKVLAYANVFRLKGAGGFDLHFIMKVAKEGDGWDPGYSHANIPVLYGTYLVEYSAEVRLRPGRYTIAIIAYDATQKKGNIVRKRIKLGRMGKDPLQEFNGDVPDVQFSEDDTLAQNLSWPLGKDRSLPVKSRRHLCVDLVVNTSNDYLFPKSSFNRRPPAFPVSARSVLRYSSFFSHLKPEHGSIRVSIADVLQMRTLIDREDAIGFDWNSMVKLVPERDSETVDAGWLKISTKSSGYFSDKLEKILEDRTCASGTELPLKIIIVVSREMQFPEHTPIRKLTLLHDPDSPRLFYFLIKARSNQYDDLYPMLKNANLKRYLITDRPGFIKALKKLISEIEKWAK